MADTPPSSPLSLVHRRRLRDVWRSAGWPCRDGVELELLAAGWLERLLDAQGRETLRLTESGVQVLAAARRQHQAAFDAHEALVGRVVREMQRAGRVTWRGLRLRAPPVDPAAARQWPTAMPDVFSIRHTTRDDQVEPIVHEVKVRRADLLSDLRQTHKRAAYLGLASQCWYVLKAGIGQADEVPADCGVLIAHPGVGGAWDAGWLDVARPAPRRAMRLPLATWMSLARADAEPAPDDDGQFKLGDSGPVDPAETDASSDDAQT
jgi:hypothetical protein